MSKLKSTIPALTGLIGEGKGEAFRRSFGFVFSSDLLDWQFSDNQLGKARRKRHQNWLRQQMKINRSPETQSVQQTKAA